MDGAAGARTAATGGRQAPLDARALREQFPILSRTVHGRPLVYLDNAATTQRPRSVVDAVTSFYETCNANIHRGVHQLSQEATARYEAARDDVARYIGAADRREVIFLRGTSEAINLVARTIGEERLREGDEILLSGMEHHSNIVPWQLVARRTGARLVPIPLTDDGEIRLEDVERLSGPRTKVVAVVHTSNALGTVNPVAEIAAIARAHGALVVVDGAQAMAHGPVDVGALGCDFFALSGHKMYGPTGIGALWGRAELLEAMPPFQGGGEMIRTVRFEESTWNDIPFKFEAGTPNIAGAIGLGAAIRFLEETGVDAIACHEAGLLDKATAMIGRLDRARLVGRPKRRAGVVSFVIDGIHPHDIGTVLDAEGIAIRTGHHCAQPVMERFGLPATARASFAAYNLPEEIDALEAGLGKVIEILG